MSSCLFVKELPLNGALTESAHATRTLKREEGRCEVGAGAVPSRPTAGCPNRRAPGTAPLEVDRTGRRYRWRRKDSARTTRRADMLRSQAAHLSCAASSSRAFPNPAAPGSTGCCGTASAPPRLSLVREEPTLRLAGVCARMPIVPSHGYWWYPSSWAARKAAKFARGPARGHRPGRNCLLSHRLWPPRSA